MSVSSNTALLIMDVQPGIVDRLNNRDEFLANVSKALEAARNNRIPVIFVVVGFRAGFPEVSANNKGFNAIRESASSYLIDSHPILKPENDEVIIVKRRISAFSGSDLEVILRAKEIKHLVLSGISTSGVVLSTVREAADKDYKLTVLSDICADVDEEIHTLLINKIFPRQAEVMTCSEWIAGSIARL